MSITIPMWTNKFQQPIPRSHKWPVSRNDEHRCQLCNQSSKSRSHVLQKLPRPTATGVSGSLPDRRGRADVLGQAGHVDEIGPSGSLTPTAHDRIDVSHTVTRSVMPMVDNQRIAQQGPRRGIRERVSQRSPTLPAPILDVITRRLIAPVMTGAVNRNDADIGSRPKSPFQIITKSF